jgi:uncharacterized OB-fold protein
MTQTHLRDAKPVREGLLTLDPPALLGSTCQACGTTTFPARDFCPACLQEGPHPVRRLASTGSVFSYTVVHQAPPGRRTPYVLALIDLEEDAVRVLGQVDVPVDEVRIGMRVELTLQEVGASEGTPVVTYGFTRSSRSEGATQ